MSECVLLHGTPCIHLSTVPSRLSCKPSILAITSDSYSIILHESEVIAEVTSLNWCKKTGKSYNLLNDFKKNFDFCLLNNGLANCEKKPGHHTQL